MNALPPTLVLLVHLHLLGYESRDDSSYNEDLFNQNSRGGGERIKTMEDISFFLVGKIEGTVPRAKKVRVPVSHASFSNRMYTGVTDIPMCTTL